MVSLGAVSRRATLPLSFLVLVLALSLGVATPANAAAATRTQAFPDILEPAKIIGAAKKAPIRMVSMSNPVGIAVNLAVFGYIAYAERDSYMPIIKKFLNPTDPNSQPKNPSGLLPGDDKCTWGGGSLSEYPGRENGLELMINQTCMKHSWPGFTMGNNWYVDVQCKEKSTGNLDAQVHQISMVDHGDPGTYKNGAQVYNTRVIRILHDAPCAAGFVPIAATATPMQVPGLSKSAAPMGFQILTASGLNGGLPDSSYSATSTVKCKNVETGAITTITDTLTGHPDKIAVPSCADRVPGSIPWETTITDNRGAPGVPREIIKVTTDEDVYGEYSDCFGPTGLVCKIAVYIDGQVCTIGRDVCLIWHDIANGEPERMQCRFGSHVIARSECDVLRYAYTKTHTVTQTKPDGQQVLDPGWVPEVKPEVPVDPEPPITPEPNPPEVPEVPPDVDPNSGNCFGDAVSLNPVNWVYIPVKCALIWAFKPRVSLQTRVQALTAEFSTKFPFSIVTAVVGLPAAVGGGGCPDWVVKVEGENKNVVCESSYTAAIRGARPFLLAGMLAAAFWPLIRSIFFASVPVIKPVPTEPK